MQKQLGRNTVVLLGIGHTNAHVLRMWKMQPIENAQLVCISNFPQVTYSGMLPGVLAGQYEAEAIEIDLVRLTQSAGVRLIVDEVIGLDHQKRQVLFRERPPLAYDLLSIGVGSRPTSQGVEISPHCFTPIKPMQTFLSRLRTDLKRKSAEGSWHYGHHSIGVHWVRYIGVDSSSSAATYGRTGN